MNQDTQRTIVVTGGSRGIGRAVCAALSGPGATVYFTYVTQDETAFLSAGKDIVEAGGVPRAIFADVSRPDDVAALFHQIGQETGRVDVLVNNAGIARDGLLLRMKDQDWDDVIRVNVSGAFYCTRGAAKFMVKQRRGRIINITSIAGVAGNPGQANYAAAKAGLIGLTKTAARELASREVTVNAIAPGFIKTRMTEGMPEKQIAGILSQIPLGRAGEPRDVAAVAAFLASSAAAYITGQVIHVNGGMYM